MTATNPPAGVEWKVLDVALLGNGRPRGDGDTVNLIRKRLAQLGDDWFWLTDVEHKGIRLVWVDTPERGEDGYAQADRDLDEWILARWGRLRIVVYGSAGWDRLLGDLLGPDGESASQYLMAVKGWPPYEAPR